MEHRNSGEVVRLPHVSEEEIYTSFSVEYAEMLAPHLVDALSRHGLHASFADTATEHIKSLNVVIVDDRFRQTYNEPASRLDLQRMIVVEEQDRTEGTDPTDWQRIIFISHQEVLERTELLQSTLAQYGFDETDIDSLPAVAIDWIFAEEAITAAANACHMKNTYGKYIPDFNGQGANYRTELKISTGYLSHHEHTITPEADYLMTKRGFGLMILADSLLARQVVEKGKVAEWVVNEIRGRMSGYSAEDVQARLRSMIPEDFNSQFRQLSFELRDDEVPELDDDLFDQ